MDWRLCGGLSSKCRRSPVGGGCIGPMRWWLELLMVCFRSPRTMVLMCGYCVYRCRSVLSISVRSEVSVSVLFADWMYPRW